MNFWPAIISLRRMTIKCGLGFGTMIACLSNDFRNWTFCEF
jgi:hypothetical protein